MPSTKRSLPIMTVAVVVVVALVAIFGADAIRESVTAIHPTFASCIGDVLIKTKHLDRKKAFGIGLKLKEISEGATGMSPLTVTSENNDVVEYQLLSDENQRNLIEGCAAQHNVSLPTPEFRTTVLVSSNTGRKLGSAKVFLANDSAQQCVTDDNGRCDLVLRNSSLSGEVTIIASHADYGDAPLKVARAQFFSGLTFTLSKVERRVFIVVTRANHEVEGARVVVDPDSDAEIWSVSCMGRPTCDSGTTGQNGEAEFRHNTPFRSAEVLVTIDHEQRSFSVDLSNGPAGHHRIDWDASRPHSPGATCLVDGDAKPSLWAQHCVEPTIRKGPQLTTEYRSRFPKELGRCARVVEYRCP